MKKYLILSWVLALLPLQAQAIEVGDIMYHDRTFSPIVNVSGSKMPIGLVYWVNASRDHGLAMALNQPVNDTWANAKSYCANFTTLNANVGSWRLPDQSELIRMGKQQWNGTIDEKFKILNQKLVTITGVGEVLVTGFYHSHTQGSAGVRVDLSTGNISNGTSTTSSHFRCVMAF